MSASAEPHALCLISPYPAIDAMDFDLLAACDGFDATGRAVALAGADLQNAIRSQLIEQWAPYLLVPIETAIGE